MPPKERILEVGPTGSGKTYNWLKICARLPHVTFHVIDPDDGVDRVRRGIKQDGTPDFPEMNNIKYYGTPTMLDPLQKVDDNSWFGGIIPATKQVVAEAKAGDWIIGEHLGLGWELAQECFVDAIFEEGIGEYFLDRRKAMVQEAKKSTDSKAAKKTRLEIFEGWIDWPVIKKMYNDDFLMKLCYKTPAHLLCTSTYSKTDAKLAVKEEADLKMLYSGTLIRVAGEKHIPFKMQTVLLVAGNPREGFYMSTFLKDRGRRWVNAVKMTDFYLQYLVGVAGWKMVQT